MSEVFVSAHHRVESTLHVGLSWAAAEALFTTLTQARTTGEYKPAPSHLDHVNKIINALAEKILAEKIYVVRTVVTESSRVTPEPEPEDTPAMPTAAELLADTEEPSAWWIYMGRRCVITVNPRHNVREHFNGRWAHNPWSAGCAKNGPGEPTCPMALCRTCEPSQYAVACKHRDRDVQEMSR